MSLVGVERFVVTNKSLPDSWPLRSGIQGSRISFDFPGTLMRGGFLGGLEMDWKRLGWWGCIRTSVSVSMLCVSMTSVEVLMLTVVGWTVAAAPDRRSIELWPTFSNSSVSVSESHPLLNEFSFLFSEKWRIEWYIQMRSWPGLTLWDVRKVVWGELCWLLGRRQGV